MARLTREQRIRGMEEAFSSLRLSGLEPSAAARQDAEDYVEGRRSLDEIIRDVVARHQRLRAEIWMEESGRVEPIQPGEVALYMRWITVRARLETALGEQSRLPAPLAAYAVDHVGALNVRAIRVLREEYGVSSEPSAEDLLLLLQMDDSPSP